jgi:hypothetical protein
MDLLESADDPMPTASEVEHIQALTAEQVAEIDAVVLSNITPAWRKVALIVAKTLRHFQDAQPELPDVYYAMRIAELVQRGELESQGNLRRMRFSEVRLS